MGHGAAKPVKPALQALLVAGASYSLSIVPAVILFCAPLIPDIDDTPGVVEIKICTYGQFKNFHPGLATGISDLDTPGYFLSVDQSSGDEKYITGITINGTGIRLYRRQMEEGSFLKIKSYGCFPKTLIDEEEVRLTVETKRGIHTGLIVNKKDALDFVYDIPGDSISVNDTIRLTCETNYQKKIVFVSAVNVMPLKEIESIHYREVRYKTHLAPSKYCLHYPVGDISSHLLPPGHYCYAVTIRVAGVNGAVKIDGLRPNVPGPDSIYAAIYTHSVEDKKSWIVKESVQRMKQDGSLSYVFEKGLLVLPGGGAGGDRNARRKKSYGTSADFFYNKVRSQTASPF